MQRAISIGIIGDYNPEKISHPATNAAIQHAAKQLSIQADYRWIPTPSFLGEEGQKSLAGFDCIWAASGSPYQSSDGALKGIQIARELDKPFIGTWGGFQHTLLEYARHVAGLTDAGHTEEDPNTTTPLLVLAACPIDSRPQGTPRLTGGLKIEVTPDTLAHRIFRSSRIEESFRCNYELNPVYREKLEKTGLKVSGVSLEGGARIIELPDHRFFIATGFLPEISSEENRPHPLIAAFLKAGLNG